MQLVPRTICFQRYSRIKGVFMDSVVEQKVHMRHVLQYRRYVLISGERLAARI